MRAVVKRNDANSLRQSSLNRIDLLFDRLNYIQRVDAVARDDHAANRLSPVTVERARAERIAKLYVRNVANVDRSAVRRADDDVRNVINRFNQPKPANNSPLPGLFQNVSAYVRVRALDRFYNCREWQVVTTKFVRVNVNLILLNITAHARNFRDAGHRVQLIAHEPILQRSQISQVHTVTFERVPEDLPYARCVRP